MDVRFCYGCENDFYNGKNPYGIAECWHRAEAKRESFRLIPIDLRPPYLHIKPTKLPTCYTKKRHAKIILSFWISGLPCSTEPGARCCRVPGSPRRTTAERC